MIMMLFGALSAGTKTYLLCRSDRHAFTFTFYNTLPVGCYIKISSSLRYLICFSLISPNEELNFKNKGQGKKKINARGWYLPATRAICFIFAGRVLAGGHW